MNKLVACVLGVLPAILLAGDETRKISVESGDKVIPQIAVGGGWSTIFTLVNLYNEPAAVEIRFYDDNGLPLPVNTNTSQGFTSVYRVTLPVRGSHRITLTGGSTTQAGWAESAWDWNVAVVGISAVFRQSIDGRPDFEALSQAITPEQKVRVPFDETNGFSTGLALCNPGSLGDTYNVTVRDEAGSAMNATPIQIQMPSKAHTAFALTSNSQLRDLVLNRKGVLDIISANSRPIGVLGLRFSPSFSFASVVPWKLAYGE